MSINPYLRILAKEQGSAKTDVLALPFVVSRLQLFSAQSQAVVLHAVREILQVGFEREQHALHLW